MYINYKIIIDTFHPKCYFKISSDAEIRIEAKDAVYIQKSDCVFRDAVYFFTRRNDMETRVAVISIIIENPNSVQMMNDILHQYGEYIIGRMGIPYRKKGINIISIALDAPQDIINTLSGKIGRLDGVSSKAAYSK